MKPHFPKKQVGMGMTGWMLAIAIFGGVLTFGFKIIPPFIDHNTMSKVLDGMAEIDKLSLEGDDKIKRMIRQRFKMNNVRDFDVRENVELKRSKKGVRVVMDYEVRTNLFMNVDLIASFDKSVELRN